MCHAYLIRTVGGPFFIRPIAKGNSVEEVKNALNNDERFIINRFEDNGLFYGTYIDDGEYAKYEGYPEPYSAQSPIMGVIKELA